MADVCVEKSQKQKLADFQIGTFQHENVKIACFSVKSIKLADENKQKLTDLYCIKFQIGTFQREKCQTGRFHCEKSRNWQIYIMLNKQN